MSWPQWPPGNVPQSNIVQPSILNPAPPVNTSAVPTSQYTAEQWAQMQHQNWQQWVQWQQQFQLWQQQYGAEYQKSMNAIAQTGVPTQPPPAFMNVPPLPAEIKPPPPPEDAAPAFTMNVPPPVTPPNYTTAPPPQLPNTNPPTFENKFAQNRNNPPPINTNNFQQYESGNNQQKFNRNQNYNRGPNPNWQNQNPSRNQPSFNRFNQPPPPRNENENKFEVGAKRPSVNTTTDSENSKRNKLEANEPNKPESNPPSRWGGEAPKPTPDFQVTAPTTPTPKNNNTEELSEAEKKFDKQFHDWEAQFQKWKQQNANHPDKQQYREYEKKWETWRSQLLERREQMKRKRLGLSSTLSQLVGDKSQKKTEPDRALQTFEQQSPQPQVAIKSESSNTGMQPDGNKIREGINQISPESTSKPLNVGFLRPPPNLNNQPLEFKKANESFGIELQNEDNKANLKLDPEHCDFLNTTNSGGIPGLDLVKDLVETDDVKENLSNATENPKPDLEAISRGINSILGDQKLMSMLSLVSQNQNQNRTFTQTVPAKVESPKFSPTEYNQKDEYEDYESEHLKFEHLDDSYEQSSPSNSETHNKFNFNGENSNEGQLPKDLNRNFGNFGNSESSSLFNTNVSDNANEFRSDFGRDNLKRGLGFNKGFDSFPSRFGDFNKNPGNMGQANSGSFRSGNDWNQSSDLGAGNAYKNVEPKPFNREPESFNDTYIRRPPNFSRGVDSISRVPDNFTRPPPLPFNRDTGNSSFRNFSSDRQAKGKNFGMGSNAFNRNVPNFNEEGNGNMHKIGNFSKSGNLHSPFGRNFDNAQQRPTDDSARFGNRDFYSSGDFQNSGGNAEDFERKSEFNKMYPPRDNFPTNFNNRTSNTVGHDNSGRSQHLFNKNPEDFTKSNFLVEGTRNRNPRNEDLPVSKRNSTEKDHLNKINQGASCPSTAVSSKIDQPDDPESDLGIWKTKAFIDYDHKSLAADDMDIILEPCYTFDYRHKPLNRIPYPSRPKWLTDMISKYPEFDLVSSRNSRPMDYRSYPTKNRFESNYVKYDDRSRKSYDDRNKRSIDDFDRDRKVYDDRSRKVPEDKERWGYDNRSRKVYDEKDRRMDRDVKAYEEKNKIHEDNARSDKNCNEDQRLHNKNDKCFDSNFEDFEDEEFDFEDADPFVTETIEVDNAHGGRNVEQPTAPASKSNILLIEDILGPPGRFTRPPRIVIILRGPPGSGKSFLAKLIKDKEVDNGGSAPRILCLDDYFMVEQEKEVEEDGRKVKVKEMVYEYEEEMEAVYRQSLMKSFKKTITDGYFNFIVVDNINDKVKYFGEMWSFAKQNGFQVYICQMELDAQICTKRNIHGRSESEIEKCVAGWEQTPSHHPVLDATSLIQSGSIPEVEMEEINSPSSENLNEEREFLQERLIASKWDNFDYSNDNLAKLDGTNKPLRPNRTMEDYLQLDDEWIQPVSSKPGQKRVRWADLEERKQQEKMRAIGFVVGQTNWDRMMDPTMGGSALTQTKYIERYSKY